MMPMPNNLATIASSPGLSNNTTISTYLFFIRKQTLRRNALNQQIIIYN